MFTLTLKSANEGAEKVLCDGKQAMCAYDNDTKSYTTEVVGTAYSIVLQANKYQTMVCKIKGADPLPQLTHEALKAANDNGTPVMLIFDAGMVKSGTQNGWEHLSATATGVSVATKAVTAKPASAQPTQPAQTAKPAQPDVSNFGNNIGGNT